METLIKVAIIIACGAIIVAIINSPVIHPDDQFTHHNDHLKDNNNTSNISNNLTISSTTSKNPITNHVSTIYQT